MNNNAAFHVTVRPYNAPEGKTSTLRAFATITVLGVGEIRNCRIVEGRNGLFATGPQEKDRNGVWRDVVTLAEDAKKAVLEAYAAATTVPA